MSTASDQAAMMEKMAIEINPKDEVLALTKQINDLYTEIHKLEMDLRDFVYLEDTRWWTSIADRLRRMMEQSNGAY